MSDEYLNLILQIVSDDIVVPVLAYESDPNINFKNVACLLNFVLNLALKYPELSNTDLVLSKLIPVMRAQDYIMYHKDNEIYELKVESFFKDANKIINLNDTMKQLYGDISRSEYEEIMI